MNWKLIKQNKAFLSIIVVLFTLFGLVLYIGGNQIYEREAQWQHGNTVARLLSSKEIAGKYFSEFRHNLFFIRDIPSVQGYIKSNFEPTVYRNETVEIFHSFVKAYGQYVQIGIIDSTGQEKIRVENKQNGAGGIASNSHLNIEKCRRYFQETMNLDNDQLFVSPLPINPEQQIGEAPYIPIIRLATPLFNADSEKKGCFNVRFRFYESSGTPT